MKRLIERLCSSKSVFPNIQSNKSLSITVNCLTSIIFFQMKRFERDFLFISMTFASQLIVIYPRPTPRLSYIGIRQTKTRKVIQKCRKKQRKLIIILTIPLWASVQRKQSYALHPPPGGKTLEDIWNKVYKLKNLIGNPIYPLHYI